VAEETKPNESAEEVTPAEVTEDDLRKLVGEVVEEKLSVISDGIGGIVDSVVEKLKGEGSSEEGLLEKIGTMIDEKLKGIGGSGTTPAGNGAKEERIPKLRIFK
jgi:hypothetical protein